MNNSPAPTPNVHRLTVDDAGEILTLQRAAYISEAQLHNDLRLPALTQTLAELQAELADSRVIAWGIRDDGRLIASMRITVDGSVAQLGRLTVAPDRQGMGLGTHLLSWANEHLPDGVQRIELFTGENSTANIRLYERMGYAETHRQNVGEYELVFLSREV